MPKIWHKYSQKRNIGALVPISTFMCLWVNYIFPRWGLPVLLEEICRLVLGIYRSLRDTWMWKLGLNCRCSVAEERWWGYTRRCTGSQINTGSTTSRRCTYYSKCCGCGWFSFHKKYTVQLPLQQILQPPSDDTHRAINWQSLFFLRRACSLCLIFSISLRTCQLTSKIAKLSWIMSPLATTIKRVITNLKGRDTPACLTFYRLKYRTLILMNGQNWKSDRNSAVMTRGGTNNQLIDGHRVNKWKLEHQAGSARTQPIGGRIKSKSADRLAWNKGYFIASRLDRNGRMIKPEQLIG
jgi:hypothetical protein